MKLFKNTNDNLKIFTELKNPNITQKDITLKLLENAQIIMAHIIKRHGDTYLPLFIRLAKEIENAKQNQSYKNIALQIAKNTTPYTQG